MLIKCAPTFSSLAVFFCIFIVAFSIVFYNQYFLIAEHSVPLLFPGVFSAYLGVITAYSDRWRERELVPVRERRVHATMCEAQTQREPPAFPSAKVPAGRVSGIQVYTHAHQYTHTNAHTSTHTHTHTWARINGWKTK